MTCPAVVGWSGAATGAGREGPSVVTSWIVAGAAVGVFYLAVAVRRWVLRPRPIPAGPATPELRDEPPAVVNLLTHRLRAPMAASATLLDLAARRAVEITEAG